MALLWTDGTWTSAEAVSGVQFSSIISGIAGVQVLTQDFEVLAASYSPLALSTAHATYTSYYLVGESNFRDLGGGIVRFTRTYAAVPSSYTEWETFNYSFVGITGEYGINVETITGRGRYAENVISKIVHEFFHCKSGETYATPGAVPVILPTYFCYVSIHYPIDWTAAATEPTSAEYIAAVTDAKTNGWSATVSSQTIDGTGAVTASTYGGLLVAEQSRLTRWQGNIWERVTRYVLAQ